MAKDLKSFFDDTPDFFPKVPKVISETLPLTASTQNDGLRLCMLFNNPLFSDTRLISSDGCSFHAHRLVLASIPYFEGLFRFQGMKDESTITFPDIDGGSLEMILRILYDENSKTYDFNDYLTLYIHADRLSSEFLQNLAYRHVRYFIDATEKLSTFQDLIDQEYLFDINLGYRLMKDYLHDGFRETLLKLTDTKFEHVMLKLTPYIARGGIYPRPNENQGFSSVTTTNGTDGVYDFSCLLNHWLYREFTTYEICCNSIRRKLPIYHKIISTYLTVKPCPSLTQILEQQVERFLPSKELFMMEPYHLDDWHIAFSMTPGLGYPVHFSLAPKMKPRTPCRSIYV